MSNPPGSKFGQLFDLTGMTQLQFARLTGLSRAYISQLRKGERRGDPETLVILAKGLGVPVGELIDDRSPASVDVRNAIRRRAREKPSRPVSKGLAEFLRLQDRRKRLVTDLATVDAQLETLLAVV
ncbi:MAG: XRE family transcriptional regulator [Alphaproteobacteria bacterium]|nr:MAG: XRE family transcriptional regulator [Alphaproteobacteria bacterium]